MSSVTLDGLPVTSCRVNMPAFGVWWAEVEIDRPEALSGAATIALLDLTLRGTIVSGGVWQGRARYRIAAGAGGWGRVVGATSYANDLGVKASSVVGDAAAACGETIGAAPTGSVGFAYTRAEGPASRVLEDVAEHAWYVDSDGVTQFGARTGGTYTGGATRVATDPAQGRIELAPTAVADLLPGVVVDGLTAVDVEHVLDAGKLRTTVYGRRGTASSRMDAAMAALIDARTAGHRYFAPWEYRVMLRAGERYDLQAVRVSDGMPDLHRVRVRPGVGGCTTHAALGSLVLVAFVNGDPARPVVVGFDDADSGGYAPGSVEIHAGSTGSIASEHATSAEALVVAVQKTLVTIGALLTSAGEPGGATITAAGQDANGATLVGGLAAGTLGTLTKAAVLAALAAKTTDTSGDAPGLGWPSVRGA